MVKNKLEFGTAGIRGILGQGEENLNEVHIIRIADGFAKYLLNKYNDVQTKGIVIGRDNRKYSLIFAKIFTTILDSNNIKVYFHENISPTPFISYSIRNLKTCGGINITASHNPKEYNGVKVYDPNGCQILPEETEELISFFDKYEKFKDIKMNFNNWKNVEIISENLLEQYLKVVAKVGDNLIPSLENIKIAYSPQHGTGSIPCDRIFKLLNVDSFYETNEMIEDEDFTYAKNPNPENPKAYINVQKVAKKNNCDIILLTDPDADRVGISVRDKNGNYKILTGNETAIIIIEFLIERNKNNFKKEQYYLIYSLVSSSLPAKMAAENNIKAYKTLTGFKWIGSMIENKILANDNEKFLFAFEESYGSLVNPDISRDKDAIQSIVILSKIASFYKKSNLNLLEVLENIYKKYGFVKSETIFIDLKNDNHLENLKQKFKNLNFSNAKLVDYTISKNDVNYSDILSYEFKNNSWISIRPSGTEPKVKIYLLFINQDQGVLTKEFNNYLAIIKNNLNL